MLVVTVSCLACATVWGQSPHYTVGYGAAFPFLGLESCQCELDPSFGDGVIAS
jgi:hypothetical protein